MTLLSLLMNIMVLCAGFTVVITFLWAAAIAITLKLKTIDARLVLQKTAVLYEYIIYIFEVSAAISCACSFVKVSNHIVISLDIICIISSLMLIRLHSFKEPQPLLLKLI